MVARILGIGLVLVVLGSGCQHDARPPLLSSDPRSVATGFPAGPRASAEDRPVRLPPALPASMVCPSEPGAVWDLALQDALAIALQNSEVVRTLDGGEVSVSTVTGFDPEIARQQALAALAAFDVSVGTNFFWNRINQPTGSFYGPGIPEDSRYDQGALDAYMTKSWVTGTQTRVAYNPPTGYLFYPEGTFGLNPSHVANLEFSVNQPLLRGFGIETNRAPITIAQIKTDQTAWEFKRTVMAFVRSVEEAYWDLHAAQVTFQTVSQEIPLIEEVVRVEEANLQMQRTVPADVAKARSQLHGFRQRQIEARTSVQQRELRLRNLLNLPPGDSHPLRPITPPARAPLVFDPAVALSTALNNRPDLLRQRLGLRIRELQLVVARNGFLPQMDATALYRLNGIGENLGDALQQMGANHYNDWQFGLTFSMPLGRNAARANVRTAELLLEKDRVLLDQAVHEVSHQLCDLILGADSLRAQYAEAEARVQETNRWLYGARIRYQNPPPAGEGQNWLLLALDDYLMAMRSAADAATEASAVLARYNTQVSRLKEAEGTLLACDEICLLNDPTSALRNERLPSVRTEGIPREIIGVPTPAAPPGPLATPTPRELVEPPLPTRPTPALPPGFVPLPPTSPPSGPAPAPPAYPATSAIHDRVASPYPSTSGSLGTGPYPPNPPGAAMDGLDPSTGQPTRYPAATPVADPLPPGYPSTRTP